MKQPQILYSLPLIAVLFLSLTCPDHLARAAAVAAVTDYTTYNAGSEVRIRIHAASNSTAAIRYAGERSPVAANIAIHGSSYVRLWTIPWDARTGRYEVDLMLAGSKQIHNATSFAVHRQLAKVMSVDLDKTFYTSGDSVNPRIVIGNVSNRRLENLQVEFEPYTYPWIAPAPDEPPMWKHIVAQGLALGPGEQKGFEVANAATVQVEKEPVIIYYSVVIRDTRDPDRIYDLAFAPAAFTTPPNIVLPKQYPFLYLYSHLSEVTRSEAYRHFYPAGFVSGVVEFNTAHTMFPMDPPPAVSFSINQPAAARWDGPTIWLRVSDTTGKQIQTQRLAGALSGNHEVTLRSVPAGVYTVEVSIRNSNGAIVARNESEFAVNPLPKSILVFCAHQDDETAHPGIIRAAVENHIPIHFVYFTGGDAGGCDRFYMHSCDAARAMDFGEVRMEEARASLAHMGVPRTDIWFLGLPDGGLGQIWEHHIAESNPYLSVLLASDHTPYREAAIPNLPYARESVIAAAKQFIVCFQPDMIITGHPDERHVDHRTNNWIVVKAMQELLRQGAIPRETKLIVDAVYGPAPMKPAPYHYEKQTLYVSGEAARIAQEATWYYQSQDGNHEQANIVDFDKLPRGEPFPHFRILDWQDHEGWNERP